MIFSTWCDNGSFVFGTSSPLLLQSNVHLLELNKFFSKHCFNEYWKQKKFIHWIIITATTTVKASHLIYSTIYFSLNKISCLFRTQDSMKFRGSFIIIVCCFLLQFLNLGQKRYTFSFCNHVIVVCFQGLMFLIYPLLGHLAGVYLTRYRMLNCGLVIILVTGGIA